MTKVRAQSTEPETGSESQKRPEAIAIVGMALQVPGADALDDYWGDIREGVGRIVRHSREEMLENGAAEHLVDDPYWVNASAPLEDPFAFDAGFFGYSAREAETMDPQHRVFLECAYHGLEEAGYDPARFDGSVGVYAGATMNTYVHHNLMAHGDVFNVIGDLQTMIGNDKDFLATRVSYKLDLRGPSVSVQTACSSSLVAVHMASRALLDHECDMAIAGGSSIRMPHGAGYLANPGGTSSPDGHCRTFDEQSAGSVTGSGAGVVVLRRLSDALRDGDRIHAIIRGSAINNDGSSKASFSAPSVEGQARVIERALSRAQLDARKVSYVEAHGTGTLLGDPIEVAALTRAFRTMTEDKSFCYLGSVKPNIGHLDAAAGVASLIKTVLILKNREIPPVVNFQSPNPQMNIESTPFIVPSQVIPVTTPEPMIAGVNSLGMGGTNAHIILEEAPKPAQRNSDNGYQLPLVVSAKSEKALHTLTKSLGQWMRENSETSLSEITETLAIGRPELPYRHALVATDRKSAVTSLLRGSGGKIQSGHVESEQRLAFLFPGQGTQRLGMGVSLARQEPAFNARLERCIDLFQARGGIDLRDVLSPRTDITASDLAERIKDTSVAQAALFSVEWALAATLIDRGIRPDALLGHSIGEWVAAAIAEVASLEDVVEIVAARGRAMADSPGGRMIYARISEEMASRIMKVGVSIAAVNAPGLVSFSGTAEAIGELTVAMDELGVKWGDINVNRAFHSPLLGEAADAFEKFVSKFKLSAPRVPIMSNVTGELLTAEQATDPQYWAQQILKPVRFGDGVNSLVSHGISTVLEVGAGRTLSAMVAECSAEIIAIDADLFDDAVIAGSIERLQADLWLQGIVIDWAQASGSSSPARVSLPGYPFARTHYRLSPVTSTQEVKPGVSHAPVAPEVASGTQTPPTTGLTAVSTEAKIARVWQELLGVDPIKPKDNFFDLGGHSLLATQLIVRLRKEIGSDIPMVTLFEAPTLGEFTQVVMKIVNLNEPTTETSAPKEDLTAVGSMEQIDPEIQAQVDALSDEEVQSLLAQLASKEDNQ